MRMDVALSLQHGQPITNASEGLLKTLAEEQADLYEDFGYGRLVMIDAFRAAYEDDFLVQLF